MKRMVILVLFSGLLTCLGFASLSGRIPPQERAGRGEEMASAKRPQLLDLGAHKCIPCQQMAPILDELAKTYKGVLEVTFVDVWKPENRHKAREHKVSSIPTQIFLDPQGKELWRHEGFLSREEILKKWRDLGYDLKPRS